MRKLTAVEVDFIDRAPIRIVRKGVVQAPVGAVFAAIACHPNDYSRWFPGFSRASDWVSAPPHGVGSQRTMQALGSLYKETILAWNVNDEFAFRVDACPWPAHLGMAERWRMRALNNGSTELTWSMAIEPTRLAPVVRAIWSLVTRVMMGLAARGLAKYLGAEGDAAQH